MNAGELVRAAPLLLLAACGGGVRNAPDAPPPRLLSAWGLFQQPLAELRPSTGVLPYDLNTPLFSDYADKNRFVWMPPGQPARYREHGVLEFPVGTILVKIFSYPRQPGKANSGRRILETRLLVRGSRRWWPLPYVWNEGQTDAELRLGGTELKVAMAEPDGTPHALDYLVPNANMCVHCHDEPGHFAPLGPKVRNLNRDLDYADGRENQLQRWRRVGFLAGGPPPAQAPRAARFGDPTSGTVEQRARTWLDVNCAGCHSPHGRASSSDTYYGIEVTDPLRLGIGKPPVSAGIGTGGRSFGIVPGDADASILIYRVESTRAGVAMPEIGRQLVHKEAVALLRRWIDGMH